MGIMGCFRNNCDNIMCNRYSSKYGYICSECFDQLLNSSLSIKEFMASDKEEFEIKKDRYEELDKEFKFKD